MRRNRRSLAALLLVLGCARSLPPAYVSARDAAEASYSSKDYRGAAKHWHTAAEQAGSPRDRHEAVYREAVSLERAGETSAAAKLYSELKTQGGERGERAAYSLAEMSERAAAKTDSLTALRSTVVRYPNAGLARGAATRFLAREQELGGMPRALHAIEQLVQEVRGSELEESLRYARAQRLEQSEQTEAALSAYLDLAARFPYPYGAFWDDALLAAARLDEMAGRHAAAIRSLERLLSEREQSRLNGSYERVAYAEARYRLAEIYRDGLHDSARARAEFRKVWRDHPTSRLRDDALFEEALLALGTGDEGGACAPADLLRRNEVESRFAACAPELCARLTGTSAQCHLYLRKRIDEARSRYSSSSSSR